MEKRSPASVSRTSLQPTFTVVGNASGRDLGSITRDLEIILTDLRTKLKPGNRIELAGQAALMETAYSELIGGLGLAAVLVFLVMVVNFQSWTLPFVAIAGLPVSVSGALFALWLTGTPLSVPALMGIIMVVGVSLFIRLVQLLGRPAKVVHECKSCGLRRHELDAVHCKACGGILRISHDNE